jgi:hypothetical protein
MYRCISAYPFITVLSLLLPCIIILLLHLLSTNHKCTQPCYFSLLLNLLLRRRGWTGILWWRVLGNMLPRLSFMWCYGVFCCSVPLRVIIVFRDTIYVIIIILYSGHLVICEHFWPYVWNNWSWVMHAMSTWFSHKKWVWHSCPCTNWSSWWYTCPCIRNVYTPDPLGVLYLQSRLAPRLAKEKWELKYRMCFLKYRASRSVWLKNSHCSSSGTSDICNFTFPCLQQKERPSSGNRLALQ